MIPAGDNGGGVYRPKPGEAFRIPGGNVTIVLPDGCEAESAGGYLYVSLRREHRIVSWVTAATIALSLSSLGVAACVACAAWAYRTGKGIFW